MRQPMTAAVLACAVLATSPAHSQVDAAKGEPAESVASRKERARLWDESHKPQAQQKLTEARILNSKVLTLYRGGKSHEALPLANRALTLRKEVLGERHPHYAASLAWVGLLLDGQGDLAAARPLHERALAITKEVL